MCYVQTAYLKMLILIFFVLSTQSVQFLFSPIQRDISEHSQTWRHTATVLFNKQTHQILQLFSCVSSFTYGNNFTNPSSNFLFFRDLCIAISY